MNVDPIHILQVTLYSKIVNETVTLASQNNKYIYVLLLIFMLYKISKLDYVKNGAEKWFHSWSKNEDEAVIIIPQHKRIFTTYSGGQSRESVQQLYSERFRALNHYLDKHHPDNINKMIEISRRETKSIWDSETVDYLLLPVHNEKILIHKDLDIYFEITITEEAKDHDDKKSKDVAAYKNYTYKLSKSGRDSFGALNKFLEDCVAQYNNDVLNKKEHSIFEYIKYKRDEDDRCELMFRKYPFRSNKHLEKNIFFEGKDDFIRYVDRFTKKSDPAEKNASEIQYEDAGVTFKAGIMMIGPPGCGKSSTIRGILNRTKRHGVLVRWSTINTCAEFCSLLRSTKINDVQYEPGELCFIFEDFDANNDDVLKRRIDKQDVLELTPEQYSFTNSENSSDDSIDDVKQELAKAKKALENMITVMNQKKEDALTLDCVLNTIDGIMELHDIMMIFTTNHLEKIDPAFTRPGRIDYILKLENASVETIKQMLAHKYKAADLSKHAQKLDQINGSIISPADVQITCLKYGADEIEDCLDELIKKTNLQ